jgi:hypothetical protein
VFACVNDLDEVTLGLIVRDDDDRTDGNIFKGVSAGVDRISSVVRRRCKMSKQYVKHAWRANAETGKVNQVSSISEITFLTPKYGVPIIGTMLISCKKKLSGYDDIVNTIPSPFCGTVLHLPTKWSLDELKEKNLVVLKFWRNTKGYRVKANIEMWTTKSAIGEKIFLRTLIFEDSTEEPLDADNSFKTYFTPTKLELKKNNGSTVFEFRAQVVMHTKKTN